MVPSYRYPLYLAGEFSEGGDRVCGQGGSS